ncbi:MAG: cupin [Nitriliruptorales bacterium]|nr:cupin [Nitriliruptorales bacterium]
MRKPELEFTPVEDVPWTAVDDRIPGLSERILARDGDTPVATRMLKFAPGTGTSVMGTQIHDFWEEVYILSGELHDLVLGETFPEGTYACRPPGMRHGPWVSTPGCVTFEVRYPVYPGDAPA